MLEKLVEEVPFCDETSNETEKQLTVVNREREKKQKDKLMTDQKSQDVPASERTIQLEGESSELKHKLEYNHFSKETKTGKVKEVSTPEFKLSTNQQNYNERCAES